MYECRHTFAPSALVAGKTPEWVARTLGHVDTSVVYKTYGRYIPNLTRQDGSAFEKLYSESTSISVDTNRHNLGHNGLKSCPWNNIVIDLICEKNGGGGGSRMLLRRTSPPPFSY
jgi:hypothetical protein